MKSLGAGQKETSHQRDKKIKLNEINLSMGINSH